MTPGRASRRPTHPPQLRSARRATALLFAVHGCVTGSFAARVPWIATHVGVGVGQLGLALLMPGIGAVVALPVSGRLAHDLRTRTLVMATFVAWCAALILPSLPTSLALLCVVLVAFGASAGLADMAMNAQGVLIERRMGRSVMSGLHGFWSLGVLTGSGVSALAAHVGIGAVLQFTVVAGCLVAIALTMSRWLLEDEREPVAPEAAPPRFALPTRPILLIGLVGLCAVFGEQAGTDWSAVFIRHQIGSSAGTAAPAVSVFAVTMATARLTGDRVIRSFGPIRTVRLSGVCAACGAIAVILAPDLGLAFAGFALLGAGVALVVPLAFAAAGRVGPHPARSIAGVAGIAYGSGLVTPGLIGGIASATSLKVSFCVVACLVAIMVPAAGVLRAGGRPLPRS